MVEEGNALVRMGYEVDIELYTLGDILDLSDDTLPLKDRIMALGKGITKGNIRDLKLVDMPKFVDAISAALAAESNPTSESR